MASVACFSISAFSTSLRVRSLAMRRSSSASTTEEASVGVSLACFSDFTSSTLGAARRSSASLAAASGWNSLSALATMGANSIASSAP